MRGPLVGPVRKCHHCRLPMQLCDQFGEHHPYTGCCRRCEHPPLKKGTKDT